MVLRQLAVGAVGTVLLTGTVVLSAPSIADAASQPVHGIKITPAQPYVNNPDTFDWLGSYMVNGKQSWCIDFALKAPDTNGQFTPGQAVQTKWGTPLDPTVAAEISYLLLRYGDTQSDDIAAALAHLLHTWTAAPTGPPTQVGPGTTNPGDTFTQIAYDGPAHLNAMPDSTKAAVATLQADADANHGPWTAAMTAPNGSLIGKTANWTISVQTAAKKGVSGVPVTVTATDATLPNGTGSQVFTTPTDGSALQVAVTPTGPNPKLDAKLDSPAANPVVEVPADPNVQKLVTTGGTTPITATATTPAQTPPGNVTITKTDANSKAPLAGANFVLTGQDKVHPAMNQDGSPANGSDGAPLGVTTKADGTATITGLHTPQVVCLVETGPPPGFDQAFDPHNPPSACGTVNPGATLQLALTNVPNRVPEAIPAGGPPTSITATGAVVSQPAPGALLALGGLLVLGAGGIGSVLVRRARRR